MTAAPDCRMPQEGPALSTLSGPVSDAALLADQAAQRAEGVLLVQGVIAYHCFDGDMTPTGAGSPLPVVIWHSPAILRVEAVVLQWREVVASKHSEALFQLIEQHADLAFELENAFLDQFDAGDSRQRSELAELVLAALSHGNEAVQCFACDLLTSPAMLVTAKQVGGCGLGRQLQHLAQDAPPPVCHYAAHLLTQVETGAAQEPSFPHPASDRYPG